jgi:osmotically-inducible protein OsmY
MQGHDVIEKNIRAALEREPRVNLHRSPIRVRRIEDGTVVLMGDMASIEEKRVAVMRASAIDGVHRLIDRLLVRPTTRTEDGALRDSVCRHLFEEPVYLRTALSCRIEGDTNIVSRRPDEVDGTIDISVANGVVMLRGQVLSLSHKRVAAVLAWWAPGCCDVVNQLDVQPPEEDNDDEVSDAIRLVLDKDPLLDADQISVQVRDCQATLRGVVATDEEKRMTSHNAWYVDGVRNVINEIKVYRRSTGQTL